MLKTFRSFFATQKLTVSLGKYFARLKKDPSCPYSMCTLDRVHRHFLNSGVVVGVCLAGAKERNGRHKVEGHDEGGGRWSGSLREFLR